MKRLFLAAMALCALLVPASAIPSKKTEVIDSQEFNDLTVERKHMHEVITVSSRNACGKHVNQNNCYIGGFFVNTGQLTVRDTNTSKVHAGNHNSNVSGSESINSTVGTYEVTQLRARLA